MKYQKSDKCLKCGNNLFPSNSKRSGRFLCLDCTRNIEQELMELLQQTEYKDIIKEVSLVTCSRFGSSHKTTTIVLSIPNQRRWLYIPLSTDKILRIKDLNDESLLLEYLEIEIKCHYTLYMAELKHMEQIANNYLSEKAYYSETLEDENDMNRVSIEKILKENKKCQTK